MLSVRTPFSVEYGFKQIFLNIVFYLAKMCRVVNNSVVDFEVEEKKIC